MKEITMLFVEDDKKIRQTVSDYFEENEYLVLQAEDGEQAIQIFQEKQDKIDLILLDGMLPKKDGFDVLREIREMSDVPIVMLSARETENDQVKGFRLGADLYVTKPFIMRVLKEQIQALLSRIKPQEDILVRGDLTVNLQLRRAYLGGRELETTPKEYEVLLYFVKNEKIVLDRNRILDAVWGIDYYGDYRTVDTIVKQLRKKMTEKYPYIKSVYGVGYYFEV